MHQILIELPALHIAIPSYQSLLLLAVLTGLLIGPIWVEALEGIERRKTMRVMLLLTVAAFVGGRLHFVANQWHIYAEHPIDALKLWSGGLHAGGAIMLLVVAMPLALRHYRIPVGRFADGFIPTIGIGIAIARVGCFLHGCCFGTPCQWPWCVSFPRHTSIYEMHSSLGILATGATRTAPIHPLQLYFVAGALAITAIAVWLHSRRRYPGQVALVALTLFAVSTAVLEFFRADHDGRVYWGPLPQLEWTALLLAAAAVGALLAAERAHRNASALTASFAARTA